ncbi:MAG: ABC-F family ATP-binding cassette domain-containing protein [Phycisphaerales bacterium]|nr:ABC-F family ATP-binding cassette domain-containing protein [Phycisphaerales bacterium]
MPLVAAVNLKHAFGNTIILDGCSLSVEQGERIGIVGRNGTGKSTLLKAICGILKPDTGSINIQRGCRVGYLHQDPNLDTSDTLRDAAERAFDELHRLHEEQHQVFDDMAAAQKIGDQAAIDRLMKQQARLETQIEAAGGYAIDHKIDSVLHGLGFSDAQFSIRVGSLSGGQRGRLALGKLLLEAPDVLLLDEPTNHLDIDGRLWLEDFLKNTFRGAVVMISHDRYLLDNVVTHIAEVEQGRLIDYPGNYADFVELRAERRLAMHRAYENQQDKFKKEEAFIRRYKAGQRAKQARGRETRLAREKSGSTLERPMELATFSLDLPKAARTGDIVLSARGLSKKYTQTDPREGAVGEKILFQDLDISISRGERWGIIGPNGAGKTTLVRVLLGDLEPDSGWVKLGSNLNVGYYRQTHEHVQADLSVYRYLQKVIMKEVPGAQFSEQQARNLAGAFLFSGDEQERTLDSLSGGERSRAVLAGLMASAKNVLVLDEPTNHLDISSAERLEDALSPEGGFEGTLILISHDRALIDATCEHLLVLDGAGHVEVFHGNYTEWHEKDQARRAEREREAAEAKRRREDSEKKRAAAEENRRREEATARKGPTTSSLARLKTEQLEGKIEKLEARIKQIDADLADPDTWRDHARAARLSDERRKLADELEPLEFEWARRAGET